MSALVRSAIRNSSAWVACLVICWLFASPYSTVDAQISGSAKRYFDHGVRCLQERDLDCAIFNLTAALELNSRPSGPHPPRQLPAGSFAPTRYEGVMVLDRFNEIAYYNRGIAFWMMGDPDSALADFDRAISINPSSLNALLWRGRVKQNSGDLDGAIADYDRVITLNPRSAHALNNRGIARQAKRDLQGAVDDFTRAISINPRLSEAYANRGVARTMMGDVTEGVADLTLAISIDPRDPSFYTNRGEARRLLGDLDKAVADFDHAILLDPRWARAYAGRGLARLQQGKREDARKDFNRCISLDPKLRARIESITSVDLHQ
jgi:tetratricopeptide (TPR) repeat protein